VHPFRQADETRNGASDRSPRTMARAIGWCSIGLGAAQIIAPRRLSGLIGIRPRAGTMRLMGLRELAAGIGILAARNPMPWFWARAGGDLMDLAALSTASRSRHSNGRRVAAAMAAVTGVAVVDALCASKFSPNGAPVHFTASVIVNRSPEECYSYWHDIEKLPKFIDHLKSVWDTGEGRSHWVIEGPAGQEFGWDAQVTEDVPNATIAWQSVDGSDFPNWGRVRFESAPGMRGTIIRLLMNYEPPVKAGSPLWGQILGAAPAQRARKDLLRFKQLIEAGEIATTQGQPAGRRSGTNWFDRAFGI
jgi:uncharacterized membrane protein